MVSKFISVEGVDCTGKTSVVPALAEHLQRMGYTVITMREPGGTPAAERMCDIMLTEKLSGKAQLLLMCAQRAENVEKIILPHLKGHNTIVLSDRFYDSTFAYQGFGNNMVHQVMEMEKFTLNGFAPDHTLFLDIPFEEAERRLAIRPVRSNRPHKDVFEDASVAFRKAVYQGYQERLNNYPDRMVRIDATRSQELVAQQVLSWANETFPVLKV